MLDASYHPQDAASRCEHPAVNGKLYASYYFAGLLSAGEIVMKLPSLCYLELLLLDQLSLPIDAPVELVGWQRLRLTTKGCKTKTIL